MIQETPTHLIEPMLAVSAWKHQQFIHAQRVILELALERQYVSPGDIPEDTVADADRQGVMSNAWNMLRTQGLIQRVPMSLTIPAMGIYGGRVMNKNKHAKGRWCAVYRLVSKSAAELWLSRNGGLPRKHSQTRFAQCDLDFATP